MKNKKILTISVAAYNLGTMIEKNLNSLINSKYIDEIEIIVTNDGSTDNTADIIESYANKHPETIKFINKKNEGAGSTVNCGIKNATGKYFKMIDGDDWVNTNEFDKLVEKLKTNKHDYDMILTNYEIYSTYKSKTMKYFKLKTLEEGKFLKIDKLSTKYSMHNVTYRTSILKDNNILLDNGFYTDQEYLSYPIKYIKNFIYFDLNVYVYMIGREGQSINLKSVQKHLDMHELVMKNLILFYEDNINKMPKSNLKILKKNVVNMLKNHFGVLLSYKMNFKAKNNLKNFCNYIKNIDSDLYDELLKNKRIGVIVKTNYILLKPISIFYRIKYIR